MCTHAIGDRYIIMHRSFDQSISGPDGTSPPRSRFKAGIFIDEVRKNIDICDCPSSRVVQQSCQNAWQGVAHPVLIYLTCLYSIRYLS